MKSITSLHLKSPLRKRGVERVKLKFKNYFLDWEFDMDLGPVYMEVGDPR